MDCTMYAATIRSTQEPSRPAPPPRKTHRAPVKVAELRAYAADLDAEIEARSADGLTEARAVMRLVRIRRDVYAAIDALTRRGL